MKTRISYIALPLTLLAALVVIDLYFSRSTGFDFSPGDWFYQFRIPRVVAALLSGMALSVSGLMLQTLFRNPLAGPFVTGITPGASFAIGLLLLAFPTGTVFVGAGYYSIAAVGMAGGISVLLIQLFISRKTSGIFTLLLTGIMLGYLLGAGVEIMQSMAGAEQIRSFVLWGLGSFDRVYIEQIPFFTILVFGGIVSVFFLRFKLDAWQPGELIARNTGVRINGLKIQVIAVAGILAGVTTALCGPIGFVGLAAPHLARLLVKSNRHGTLLWPTLLCGGLLCVAADLLAHNLLAFQTLNVNAICALMGAPVVLWVLLRNRANR